MYVYNKYLPILYILIIEVVYTYIKYAVAYQGLNVGIIDMQLYIGR